MYNLFLKVVELVEVFGYLGIFFMTVIESTFVPIPNEITLIPAGYLVAKGSLSMGWLLFFSIAGNLVGSLITYYLAYHYGRVIVKKIGKYLFLTEDKLQIVERFFKTHGHISVFIGRIAPGIKHFISFPAGLGKMDIRIFCLYSGLGGALWTLILVFLGYFIGHNEGVIEEHISQLNYIMAALCVLVLALYALMYRNKIRRNSKIVK